MRDIEHDPHASNARSNSGMQPLVLTRSFSLEDRLSREEIVFLQAVRDGNVEDVRALLQGSSGICVDRFDFRGQQALEIAIINHDELMVRELLALCPFGTLHLYNATMRAVKEDDLDLLAMLLDSDQMIGCVTGSSATIGKKKKTRVDFVHALVTDRDGSQIRLPMTPIMSAVLNDNMKIAQFLRERGHSVPDPGDMTSGYSRNHESGSITLYQFHLNAYRTLCSPLYMALTEPDPILSAFQRSQTMRTLSQELPENESEFSRLATQCTQFATDLLSHCQDTSEVNNILTQRKGFQDPRPHRFSRLHLAIQLKQKEFVAHPYSQQVLQSILVEGLESWYTWSPQRKIAYTILHAFLTPFVGVLNLVLPLASVSRPLRVPLNRMIYSTTSYLFFLVLLFLLLYQPRLELRSSSTWIEIGVALWVVGHFWEVIVNIYSLGLETFFRSWSCVYDLVLFTMFTVTQLLWFSLCLPFFMDLDTLALPRSLWPYYHPFLIGECLFSIACIMAFARLLVLYNLHQKVGPLGLSMQRMIGDIARFLLIFFLIMFAFATGLNSIYKNYKDNIAFTSDGTVKTQSEELVKFGKTFKNLFWAIFGMVEANYADLVLSTVNTSYNESGYYSLSTSKHTITEFTGYTLWGAYHVVIVIVLLNMLIAMMSDTYKKVHKNADVEWKFARSRVWINFMGGTSTVPPPFNLMPSAHGVIKVTQIIISKMKGEHKKKRIIQDLCWRERCCYGENVNEDEVDQRQRDEEEYMLLIRKLVRQYLRSRDLQGDQGSTTGVLTQEAIQRLKAEILRDIGRSFQGDCDMQITRHRGRSLPEVYTPSVKNKVNKGGKSSLESSKL